MAYELRELFGTTSVERFNAAFGYRIGTAALLPSTCVDDTHGVPFVLLSHVYVEGGAPEGRAERGPKEARGAEFKINSAHVGRLFPLKGSPPREERSEAGIASPAPALSPYNLPCPPEPCFKAGDCYLEIVAPPESTVLIRGYNIFCRTQGLSFWVFN
jgi:hypothetical protein